MEASFRPRNFVLCSIGLALATFMQVLDSTIANVSLPTIAGNLGVSAQQGTWVVTAFAVSTAISLPLTGWFVRRIGEVRLFLAATSLFTLTSILCGLAPNMGMLIVFRALQGFAAGPLYPVTQGLMIAIFPPHKRPMAIVLITTVAVVAPILGPILGGWITDSYSWPWIFFINIPIGIFATYVVWQQMKSRPEQTQKVKMDYVGLFSLAIGVSALQIMLDLGNDEDWFNSNFITAAAIIAAIAIAVFLIWDLTDKEPMVDLRIFRHRNYTFGTLVFMSTYGVFFCGSVLVPLWLQTQLHYTPMWAGFAMAPQGVFSVLFAVVVGKYAPRFDLRMVASLALIVMAIPYYVRSTYTPDVDFAEVASMQLFQGLGNVLFFTPIMTIILSDLKPDEISSGAALAMFMRTLCSSFSVSISTYIWNSRAVLHHSQLAEQFAANGPSMVLANPFLGKGDVWAAATHLDSLISIQAYQISFDEIFLALSVILLLLVAMVWFPKPPFTVKAAANTGEA